MEKKLQIHYQAVCLKSIGLLQGEDRDLRPYLQTY